MKILKGSILIMLLSIFSITAGAIENEAFALGLMGTHPATYAEYKPILDNMTSCFNDNLMASKTCQEVGDQAAVLMYNAYLQAIIANTGKKPEDRFCSEELEKLVYDKNEGGMAATAMLAVDRRLKYGSSLYPELNSTYLGKIVSDEFRAEHPCPKK